MLAHTKRKNKLNERQHPINGQSEQMKLLRSISVLFQFFFFFSVISTFFSLTAFAVVVTTERTIK